MMNLKDAERDLREIKKILDNLKIEFFLIGGTALFAYRDNKLSGGNNRSLGIGIFGTEQHKIIRSKLLENGGKIKSADLKWDGIIRMTKRVPAMIYFFIRKEDTWWSYWDIAQINNYVFFPVVFSELETIKLKGMKIKVPSPIKDYLRWVFGRQWKDKTQANRSYQPSKTF